MVYRKDITGLRAIAVVSVLLFHFNPDWVSGGFVGVDVFFVISGFLMTGIIFRGLENNSFSVVGFYISRANRIIPALAGLCIALFVFGWLYLTPLDYQVLGEHIAGSIGFFSNFLYWKESGYFDAASHEKWLLHTWSLSVEWQFYIIFPLVLVVLHKILSLESIKRLIIMGTLTGFLFSVYATYQWPNPAYYLLPTRAWEMLLGGVAYLYPIAMSEKNKRYTEWLGLALILYSCAFFSKDDLWPGYLAIIPVLGTGLVVWANRSKSFLSRSIVLQKLGVWSYSIYLWHWVVVVLNHKYALDMHVLVYLMITLMLSFISYQLIESKRKFIDTKLVFLFSVIASVGILSSNGFENRVSEEFQLTTAEYHSKYYGGVGYTANEMIYINGTEEDYDLVISGDSYALQYAKSVDDSDLKVAGLFDHGCFIFKNYSRYLYGREDMVCSGEYPKLKSALSGNNKPLILAYSWDTYKKTLVKKGGSKPLTLSDDEFFNLIKSELEEIFEENGSMRKYYLLGIQQRAKISAYECLARTVLIGYRIFNQCDIWQEKQDIKINQILSSFSENSENVYFIDPNQYFCEEDKCQIIFDRKPMHSDKSHLSVHGAERVFKGIISELKI